MRPLAHHLHAHPRLFVAALVGVLAAALMPQVSSVVVRGLLAWNIAVWLYLLSISFMMWRADRGHLQRIAKQQSEGAIAVLSVVTAGAVVSIGAIVFELAAAKEAASHHVWPHLALALATVVGSWLLVPTLFALNYASVYYAGSKPQGLLFPNDETGFEPDYADFLYFSFTIAVAAQTADVSVSTRAMRRLTLMQSVLAFFFNTAILAFSINIAASLF